MALEEQHLRLTSAPQTYMQVPTPMQTCMYIYTHSLHLCVCACVCNTVHKTCLQRLQRTFTHAPITEGKDLGTPTCRCRNYSKLSGFPGCLFSTQWPGDSEGLLGPLRSSRIFFLPPESGPFQ